MLIGVWGYVAGVSPELEKRSLRCQRLYEQRRATRGKSIWQCPGLGLVPWRRGAAAGAAELRRAIDRDGEGDSSRKKRASDKENLGDSLGFYRGSGGARGERGIVGFKGVNGSSYLWF